MAPFLPRAQHEGGADIGMAGKRHFGARGENAHMGGVRGVLRRQHEGRFREIELGGDGLHLRRRKPARVGHDGERIAAEFGRR